MDVLSLTDANGLSVGPIHAKTTEPFPPCITIQNRIEVVRACWYCRHDADVSGVGTGREMDCIFLTVWLGAV